MEVIGLDPSRDNSITGTPLSSERARIRFEGRRGRVIIHPGVKLINCNLTVHDNALIEIGADSQIKGSYLAHIGCSIILGRATRCNANLNISTAEGTTVRLGEGCLIASATIRSTDMHPIYDLDTDERINPAGDVVIGDRVWFAQDAFVLKGVTIGSGSVVAARAVVTRDVPDNCIAAGNPAKIVRRNVRWHGKLPLPAPLTE